MKGNGIHKGVVHMWLNPFPDELWWVNKKSFTVKQVLALFLGTKHHHRHAKNEFMGDLMTQSGNDTTTTTNVDIVGCSVKQQ